jgi:dephospho-CoA kinase
VTPPVIGLTGAVAAGTSEALAAFERQGAAILSTDAVVHELLSTAELRELLTDRWGPEVAPGGEVDRARVGSVVFERPGELAWLESELHPRVGEMVLSWRRALGDDFRLAVVEVPLLFETGLDSTFDATVAVVASDEARAARAGERGTEAFDARSERQLPQDEKARRATYVVHNDGSLEELGSEIAALIPRLEALGGESS